MPLNPIVEEKKLGKLKDKIYDSIAAIEAAKTVPQWQVQFNKAKDIYATFLILIAQYKELTPGMEEFIAEMLSLINVLNKKSEELKTDKNKDVLEKWSRNLMARSKMETVQGSAL